MNVWLFVLLFGFFTSAFASLPDLQSLITHKKFSKAIQLGQQLQLQNPNSASVLFYTALAFQNNKQPKKAKTLYLKAIAKNATLAEAYNNLAHIYVSEKQYLKAADTLTLAINSQHSIAVAYANLSKIYRHLASQAYQQVLNNGNKKRRATPHLNTQLLASLNVVEPVLTLKLEKKPLIIVSKALKPALNVPPKLRPIKTLKSLSSAKQAIVQWAKAWQNKNYNAYINSYSKTYAPKNLNHTQWLSQRQKRIKRPGNISVNVSNFNLKLNKTKAYVNFDQAYRSITYQDKVRKRMHLILINDQWFITSEVTLSVL